MGARLHGSSRGSDPHLALRGAVHVVEEDGTPPVHPVDALPDADASAGLFVPSVVKQQACQETQRRG